MHATVLVILSQGQEVVAVYDTASAAWDALLQFVDQHWQTRFGHTPRPEDNDTRVQDFFEGEDAYLLASTDVTDLELVPDHLHQTVPPPMR
ncbi:hypothetical protein [Novosphingobium album (ex Liu et al. 2023)]|uniref:Uncharacterized protein n=1 Tax=Novosphingobium album (ex Liu et al. 2023) TaxID=3031130 RepID=A0ABT5WS21_9SPHN|nr:hypothetical protein [Novosphingobium album (ex Liu et al. 2023)]MDE8652838.1 hypothetical protein [Novosphingobium album (ex Liu et al. 2023)]